MKIRDLKGLPQNELKNLFLEKRDSLRQFYFKLARGRVKNLKEARETRKDIARILTILRNTKLQISVIADNPVRSSEKFLTVVGRRSSHI